MDVSSLLEQARQREPSATDEELIVAIAEEIVESLDLQPPIDERMLASYVGIKRVEVCDLPWAGCLVADGDDLVIRVRASDPAGRQRFTICHEVAHTFLPGYRHSAQYRCTPLSSKARRDPHEVLCDIAASALLLPARHMRAAVESADFGFDSIEELAEACGASLEATARRFIDHWPEPSVMIRLEVMTKPREPEGEPKLRVASSVLNGTWPFFPAYKSVSEDHVLNDCVVGASVCCKASLDCIAVSRVGNVELHARPYPFIDGDGDLRMRVLAIARRAR